MANLLGSSTDLRIEFSEEEVLRLLAHFNRHHDAIYFASGLVKAGIGFYQVVRVPSGERVLVFGEELDDFQLRQEADGRQFLANPGKLIPIQEYSEAATPEDIHSDMHNHQHALRKEIRNSYMLAQTGPNVIQSHGISYVISGEPDADGKPRKPSGHPDEKVHIHAFVDPLRTHEYAEVFAREEHVGFRRIRYSHVHLTPTGAVKASEAISKILEHHTGLIELAAHGGDTLQKEDALMRPWERLGFHLNVSSARLGEKMKELVTDQDWHDWKTWVDFAARFWVLGNLPEAAVKVAENALEVLEIGFGIFHVTHFESRNPSTKIPKNLRPYVERARVATQLGAYLRHAHAAALERAVPLTMAEARLAPANHPHISMADPFKDEHYERPSLNALDSMVGTLHRFYPHEDPHTSLMLRADGLWGAFSKERNEIYVGYNAALDSISKPLQEPQLGAWLGANKVICFHLRTHSYSTKIITLEAAKAALPEIAAAGDAYFLAADEPKHGKHLRLIEATPEANVGLKSLPPPPSQTPSPMPHAA